MPYVTLSQASIHYATFGDRSKPAIIFSNSLGTNYSMWQKQINHFKNDYFVICYDTRGHGQSSTPEQAFSLQQLGLDVIELLDFLEIQRAFFCGISMGGLIGQWLAIYHPERFLAIIIANTAAKIGQEQAWLERAALVREHGLNPIAETAATRWFTSGFREMHDDMIGDLSRVLAAGDPEGYAKCCEVLAIADLREQLNTIKLPVVVIAGKQDPITTIEDGLYLSQNISQAELLEIDASHISNIEQPDAFNLMIQKALQMK